MRGQKIFPVEKLGGIFFKGKRAVEQKFGGRKFFAALIAIFLAEELVQKLLPATIAILFLHFFEEFGFPGGFPWMGMKVLMGSKEMN